MGRIVGQYNMISIIMLINHETNLNYMAAFDMRSDLPRFMLKYSLKDKSATGEIRKRPMGNFVDFVTVEKLTESSFCKILSCR